MARTGGLAPVVAGKAIYRRRLALGWRRLAEGLRFAGVWLGSRLAAVTHTRKEIQLLAVRAPEEPAAAAHAVRTTVGATA